jgi:hypothetical protein
MGGRCPWRCEDSPEVEDVMTAAPASPDCAAELLLSGITAQRATDGILEWKLAGLPMDTAAS